MLPNNTLSRAELKPDGEVHDIHYGDILIKFGSILDMDDEKVPYIAIGKEGKVSAQLQNGDVVIADTAEDETAGKAIEIYNAQSKQIEAGLHTIPCRPIIEYAPMYLGYYMNSVFYRSQLLSLLQGIKVLSISKSNIFKTVITMPKSQTEQKKISSILYLIDLKIKKQWKIIDTIKKYKRGIIQRLFAKNKISKWKEVKLKEVVKIYDGIHQTPEYKYNGVRFISVENIVDPLATIKFISAYDYLRDFKVHPEYGDVLMTRIGDIGRSRYVDFNLDMGFYVSLALFKCSDKIDGQFLAYFITNNLFQKALWKRTLHIAFPKKINTGEIGECIIFLPSLSEQKKVVQKVTYIDKVIENCEKGHRLLELLKKGLLQQLFI